MPALEQIDPKVIGLRLAEARKARGVTQEDAATQLGCSRPTLIAIEKGTRQPKSEEIVVLAKLYGQKVCDIVRPGEPLADLQPHLRAVAQQMKVEDSEVAAGIAALQRFAEDYRRLERMLNVSLPTNDPEVVTIGRGSPVSLTGDVADDCFPDRYVFLAVQAFDQGQLSEGQLASLLRCDRVSARETVNKYLTTTEVSDDGEVRGVPMETHHSLLGQKKPSSPEC